MPYFFLPWYRFGIEYCGGISTNTAEPLMVASGSGSKVYLEEIPVFLSRDQSDTSHPVVQYGGKPLRH